jgi:hypothetical protein
MRTKCESCVFSAALMVGLAAVASGQSPDVESGNLASEVTALKTDNIALREQLNKVEELQKMLLEVVNDLRQRLGSPATPQELFLLPCNRTPLSPHWSLQRRLTISPLRAPQSRSRNPFPHYRRLRIAIEMES